jgi:hypothetical protein
VKLEMIKKVLSVEAREAAKFRHFLRRFDGGFL